MTAGHAHRYHSRVVWQGSTGVGYADYDRTHHASTPPAEGQMRLSADAPFRGDPGLQNPEQLLLVAASSCQLLTFLAMAARAGLDVLAYEDEAEAVMPVASSPMRITRVVLRPRILVGPSVDPQQVQQLVARAHDDCYIANTLSAEVAVEPVIEQAGSAT